MPEQENVNDENTRCISSSFIVYIFQISVSRVILVQYPITDRRNKENLTSLPASPDVGDSNRMMSNRSSGFVLGTMPYPAKTNAQIILVAAINHLERYGEEALSMRELAGILELSPHALYRYYPDHAALKAAVAEEGFHRLRAALVDAAGVQVGKDALRAIAAAYLAFAQAHPAWYSLLMRSHQQMLKPFPAGNDLWVFVVEQVEKVVGPEDAASVAVALWAFLHGFIQLESVAAFGEEKPRSGFQVGLEVFLSGLASLSNNL